MHELLEGTSLIEVCECARHLHSEPLLVRYANRRLPLRIPRPDLAVVCRVDHRTGVVVRLFCGVGSGLQIYVRLLLGHIHGLFFSQCSWSSGQRGRSGPRVGVGLGRKELAGRAVGDRQQQRHRGCVVPQQQRSLELPAALSAPHRASVNPR